MISQYQAIKLGKYVYDLFESELLKEVDDIIKENKQTDSEKFLKLCNEVKK